MTNAASVRLWETTEFREALSGPASDHPHSEVRVRHANFACAWEAACVAAPCPRQLAQKLLWTCEGWSASELVRLGIKGLPQTTRGMRRKANREQWRAHRGTVDGERKVFAWLYCPHDLPRTIRDEIDDRRRRFENTLAIAQGRKAPHVLQGQTIEHLTLPSGRRATIRDVRSIDLTMAVGEAYELFSAPDTQAIAFAVLRHLITINGKPVSLEQLKHLDLFDFRAFVMSPTWRNGIGKEAGL